MPVSVPERAASAEPRPPEQVPEQQPSTETPPTPAPPAQEPIDLIAPDQARQQRLTDEWMGRMEKFEGALEAVSDLRTELAELKAVVGGSRPTTTQVAAEDQFDLESLPEELRDDAGLRMVSAMAKRHNATDASVAQLKSTMEDIARRLSEREQREQASQQAWTVQRIRNDEAEKVGNWTEQVIKSDPLYQNPVLSQVIRSFTSNWVRREFDPTQEITSQEYSLRIALAEELKKYVPLVQQAQASGRQAALVTDRAAQNSPTVSGSQPPTGSPPAQNPHKPGSKEWFQWKYNETYDRLQREGRE